MDIKLTELEIRNVYESDALKTITVGLLGRHAASSYQLKELVEALLRKEQAGTAADLTAAGENSLEESTRDHSSVTSTQIEARAGKWGFKFTRVYDVHRDVEITRTHVVDLEAAADDPYQQEFEFSDEDTVYLLEAGAVFEYDYDECAEVLDAHADGTFTVARLTAAGITPKKVSGDLAQTSILTGSGQEQVLGMKDWSIDWKRKTVEATTTDDAAYESSLPSTKSWSGKAKYVFIDGDASQVDAVLSAIDSISADPLTWNFFPTAETGRAAFQGACIIDGITIASGMGQLLGLDVSFKGTGPLKRLVQAAPIANPNTVTGISAQV